MEILYTYTKMSDVFDMAITFLIIIIVVVFVFMIAAFVSKEWITGLAFLAGFIISAIILFGLFYSKTESNTTYHEVIITDYDKVNFDKYQIIEQKGRIITVEEIK